MLETDHKFASYFIASRNQVEKTRATMVFGKDLTLSQSGKENGITLCIIKASSPSEHPGDLGRLVHHILEARSAGGWELQNPLSLCSLAFPAQSFLFQSS